MFTFTNKNNHLLDESYSVGTTAPLIMPKDLYFAKYTDQDDKTECILITKEDFKKIGDLDLLGNLSVVRSILGFCDKNGNNIETVSDATEVYVKIGDLISTDSWENSYRNNNESN